MNEHYYLSPRDKAFNDYLIQIDRDAADPNYIVPMHCHTQHDYMVSQARHSRKIRNEANLIALMTKMDLRLSDPFIEVPDNLHTLEDLDAWLETIDD